LKKETTYVLFLTLLFFAVSLVGILHHELWLDESHHWLLARDSESFLALIRNTRYEGHPILWNILLYAITRFTYNPIWMQMLHIAIATTAVFIFLKKAPFSWLFKTLFIFGYFMLFEYNLLSRNYILGLVFLFLACHTFAQRDKKFLWLCVLLGLAANVHLIFGVVALALFLTVLAEQLQMKTFFRKKEYGIGYGIFALALALAVLQMLPPEDTKFFNHVNEMALSEKFTKGFISLFKGFFTIPDFRTIHFWNSNFMVNISKPFAAILGLLFYFMPILLFFRNRKTLLFVYTAFLGTQFFFFITQMSATRHDGINFVIIITALWIEKYYPSENYKLKEWLLRMKLNLLRKPIIYFFLTLQLVGGIGAYAMELKHPFTASKATYNFLKEKKLDSLDVISVTCDGTSMSPYVQKKIYFICNQSYQSYCLWDFSCALNISQSDIETGISTFMMKSEHAVYVSNYPIEKAMLPDIWIPINATFNVRFLKKFDETVVRNSYYYVYEIANINSK
jgi:hypothetical protein